MTPEAPGDHIRKAARFLGTAHTVFMARDGEATVAACYYACLHAAIALLATAGIAAETHRGVRQLFGLHFVKSGPLPGRVARDYARLMAERDVADYDVATQLGFDSGVDAARLALGILNPVLSLIATRLADAVPPELAAAQAAAVRLDIALAAIRPPET